MSSEQMQVAAVSEKGISVERIKVNRFPTSHYISVWANNAAVSVSFYDITLKLGSIRTVNAGESIEIDDHAAISMSPEHARSLVDLLTLQLEKYEQRFGKLRMPPGEGVAASEEEPA